MYANEEPAPLKYPLRCSIDTDYKYKCLNSGLVHFQVVQHTDVRPVLTSKLIVTDVS